MRTPIFAANWKMNKTADEAAAFIDELKSAPLPEDRQIVIAPPATLLHQLASAANESGLLLAAQNMFYEEHGAFTGELSPVQIKNAGCTYVIVGHSERRTIFGEDDTLINKKLLAAQYHNIIPIFCIGENDDQRETGQAAKVVLSQLQAGLVGLDHSFIEQLVIAYEPVWAIGTGKTATALQAEGIMSVIREQLPDSTRLLYGGSTKPDNAAELLKQSSVDGFLIGGASLDPASFRAIFSA